MRLNLRIGDREIGLDPPGGVIGAKPGSAVALSEPGVLYEHAELGTDNNGWWVGQLGAKPVLLSDQPLTAPRVYLSQQGTLQVGTVRIEFTQKHVASPVAAQSEIVTRSPPRFQELSLQVPQALRGDQIKTLVQRVKDVTGFDPNQTFSSPPRDASPPPSVAHAALETVPVPRQGPVAPAEMPTLVMHGGNNRGSSQSQSTVVALLCDIIEPSDEEER